MTAADFFTALATVAAMAAASFGLIFWLARQACRESAGPDAPRHDQLGDLPAVPRVDVPSDFSHSAGDIGR